VTFDETSERLPDAEKRQHPDEQERRGDHLPGDAERDGRTITSWVTCET
jgi:hypothetical protein